MKILLIDDNQADVRLIQESFRALAIHHELQIAFDAEEAWRLLSGPDAAPRPPDIILLDINLPRMDGFELLAQVRKHPKLRIVPVVVLSSSGFQVDVNRAYALGANAYMSKPMEDFVDMIGDFDRFWLRRARLPKQSNER